MRKAIDACGWVFVTLTMLTLTCTVLTTYKYIREISVFNSYHTFDLCMIFTMLIWAIKMLIDKNERSQNVLCSIFCTLIAIGTMFFMYMGVL